MGMCCPVIYAARTQYNRTIAIHGIKRAAGESLYAEMLSLIAGNMNGKRPNLISRVQYLCEVFVGHRSQIKAALMKSPRHLAGKERDKGKHIPHGSMI